MQRWMFFAFISNNLILLGFMVQINTVYIMCILSIYILFHYIHLNFFHSPQFCIGECNTRLCFCLSTEYWTKKDWEKEKEELFKTFIELLVTDTVVFNGSADLDGVVVVVIIIYLFTRLFNEVFALFHFHIKIP